MRFLFLLFLVVPLIEIVVLIKVGGIIGAIPTVIAVVGTAIIGVALLKQQGYQVLFNARSKLAAGAMPAQEMIEGMMLAVGGALLLTPGFVTDAIGFSLLIPIFRRLWIGLLPIKFAGNVSQNPHNTHSENVRGSNEKDSSGRTIEGEFRRED